MGDDKKFYNKSPKTVSSDRYIEIPEFVADTIRQKPRFFCPYQNLIKLCNTKYNTTIKKALIIKAFGNRGRGSRTPIDGFGGRRLTPKKARKIKTFRQDICHGRNLGRNLFGEQIRHFAQYLMQIIIYNCPALCICFDRFY